MNDVTPESLRKRGGGKRGGGNASENDGFLVSEIILDVRRLFLDHPQAQDGGQEIATATTRLLFVWCSRHPSLGYSQYRWGGGLGPAELVMLAAATLNNAILFYCHAAIKCARVRL